MAKSTHATAPTHATVQSILGELVVVEGGAVLPAARFDAWVAHLERAPIAERSVVAGQLVALALRFAPRRWPAAAQLAALAVCGQAGGPVMGRAS